MKSPYRLPEPRTLDDLAEAYGTRYRWILLSVVATGIVAGVLETSSFNVAIPALSRQFGLGQDSAQWTMTGFMAAMTLSMLPASWLLERIGFRRVFLGACLLLGITSIAGCFAGSFGTVVLVRTLQGAATGVLQPLGILVVVRQFPAEIQGRAAGILTLGLAATPAVAPAFGGVLVDRFGWQAIFLLSLPFCLFALVLGMFLVPRPRELRKRQMDWLGFLLLSLATISVMAGITRLERYALEGAIELLLALVLVAGFVVHARRAASPLISLTLFGNRPFAMGSIVSFTYGFGLYGSTYLIPVFLQSALGYSATAAGSALIPAGVALMLTTPVAGRLSDSVAPRLITAAGLVLLGTSFFLFSARSHDISYVEILLATVVGRIGLGLILPALSLASMRSLKPHQLSQSSVVVSYMRQLGGVLGIASTAVFVAWREGAYGAQGNGLSLAYAQGFALLGVILLAACVSALMMKDKAQAEPVRAS